MDHKTFKNTEIIIGQEAICPDGLGRVVDYGKDFPKEWFIQVDTYAKNRSCKWSPGNVTLIPILLK